MGKETTHIAVRPDAVLRSVHLVVSVVIDPTTVAYHTLTLCGVSWDGWKELGVYVSGGMPHTCLRCLKSLRASEAPHVR